ncbi:MAG: HIT domain-containing protein [Candidatus Uhrbacteria bacterium]
MSQVKIAVLVVASFVIGGIIGGYTFRGVLPRSFLALDQCQGTCLQSNELLGLLTSAGVQNLDGIIPFAVKETDKTVVLNHPFPQKRIHYVVIPKKDIKDIGSLTPDDQAYLQDAFAAIATIIKEQNLQNYRIITNGPGFQQVTRLHFHLLAE